MHFMYCYWYCIVIVNYMRAENTGEYSKVERLSVFTDL